MKLRNLLPYLVVVFVLFGNTACREDEIASAPIGKWQIEEKQASGELVRVEMEIKPENKFSGVMFVNGVPAWTYSGIWKLKNDELTYIYTESSKPLPDNSDDTDIVLSISENEYTFKSKLTGEMSTYRRMK
ncbi:MAG: hypothetical protein WBO06_13425 [Gammaproteobacteria bacterium]